MRAAGSLEGSAPMGVPAQACAGKAERKGCSKSVRQRRDVGVSRFFCAQRTSRVAVLDGEQGLLDNGRVRHSEAPVFSAEERGAGSRRGVLCTEEFCLAGW